LFAPALAVATAVVWRRCRNIVLVGLAALAATGASAYLIFWVWFLSPRAGRFLAISIPILSVVWLAFALPRLESAGRKLLSRLLLPTLLSGAFSVFVVEAGFVYGGLETPLATPETRFSHPLPPDNAIPFIFAEGIRNHYISKPLFGQWRSSDRPPLQTGFVVAQGRFNREPRQLASQVTGVLAQSLWILALWILLTALELESPVIALVFAACLTSGFVLVNTFFVWPKLLAAAYAIGALTLLVLGKPRPFVAAGKWSAVLCGALIAFGMLSHGGTIFALIGGLAIVIALRPRIPLKAFAIVLLSAFLIYLPWILYQKYFDPPGDRLLKMHLAGIEPLNPRPFGQLLVEAYGAKTPAEILDYKWRNWTSAMDHSQEYWFTVEHLIQATWKRQSAVEMKVAARVREMQFFYFIPSLGFVGFGFPFLFAGFANRFRTRYWQLAMLLSLFMVVTIVIWCVLMFGPDATVIHQGTYVTVLLGFLACCLSLWSVSPKLAQALVALQALLDVLLFSVLMTKPLRDLHSFANLGTLRYATLGTSLLAATVVVYLLYRLGIEKPLPNLDYCEAAAPVSGEVRELNTVH
jgi:hypothetical protein